MARPSAGRGIVFNTHSGGGTPRILGYRFRYLCLRGAFSLFGDLMSWVSFSIPALVREYSFVVQLALPGIVFNTRSGRGHTSHSWVSFSIPVVTGSGERKAESGKRRSGKERVSFSIPMRAVDISSTGSISLCVSGIVLDTRDYGEGYLGGWLNPYPCNPEGRRGLLR